MMDRKDQPTIHILSNSSVLFDATTLLGDKLAIQKRIWALASQCKKTYQCIDIVPAMNSLTLYFSNETKFIDLKEQLLNSWETLQPEDFKGRHHKLITRYGGENGPDIEHVARFHNMHIEDVIARHSSVHYQVLFLGFQPGFTYLHGLDTQLHTPRRSEPRTHVPKGSVAIGADQTGVYPADSPGGWHIIGHTDFTLFDSNQSVPSIINPGDTIEFIAKDIAS
ncbi:5-oxoprolinase subunit PxpB [Pseudoalteromonas neustonica]|uniref:5-oxoprolinase subunit PxpB n=1 Tax=Pseudoalteromonas neustonica TaxID=1840331 RepID=A0ABU9U1Z2_9GAMM